MIEDKAEKSASLRKPNEILVMISKDKGLTAAARKLYTVLLWSAQQEIKEMGRVPDATHTFEIQLSEALLLSGLSVESRTVAQGYLREMRKTPITWESTTPTNGPEWSDMALLSQVGFEMKNGARFVQWAFPPKIVEALLDPVTWTVQYLPTVAKLNTYEAIALYDICSRYRNSPRGVTNVDPPEWWVAALTSNKKKREWRKVKCEKIAAAIEEINRESDIEISLIENKVGRTVESVQFAVKKKAAPVQISSDDDKQGDGSDESNVTAMLIGLSIKPTQLAALMKQHSSERLVSAIGDLRKRIANKALDPVYNHLSYLNSILNQAGDHGNSSGPGPIDGEVLPPKTIGPAPAKIVTLEDEGVIARQEAINTVVAKIAAMDAVRRREMLQAVAADLKAKGAMTPSIARRVNEGDWNAPLLRAEMVKRFIAAEQ